MPRDAAPAPRSDGGKRLIEVGQQVFDVLDPDRQAHRVFRHAGGDQFGRRKLAVRRRCGVRGERAHVSDIDEPGEELQRVEKPRSALRRIAASMRFLRV